MLSPRLSSVLVLLLLAATVGAQNLRVGLATGFPPYQYVAEGRPAGLDVLLAEAVVREAGMTLTWVQRPWDEVVAILRTSADLDLVVGMEKTEPRKALFLFGRTLYTRRNCLFVRADDRAIRSLEDLSGQAVAGDRDAFGEDLLGHKGLKTDVRLIRTPTKDAAMAALALGRVSAALMPEAVGLTLARQRGVAVKVIDLGDPGTPVALAFPPGHRALADLLDQAVERLEKAGTLQKILRPFQP